MRTNAFTTRQAHEMATQLSGKWHFTECPRGKSLLAPPPESSIILLLLSILCSASVSLCATHFLVATCNLLQFQVRFEEAIPNMEAEEGSQSKAATADAPRAPKSVDDKDVIPPSAEKTTGQDSMSLALLETSADSSGSGKKSSKSYDRDIALAQVESEKRNSLIKAWEESEKTKAENKSQKKLAAIGSWENAKKAALEAQLRKIEEKLDQKKAEYGEKMKNKIATYHKEAEERRATAEAQRGEAILKAEDSAAKYRARGQVPNKYLWCFTP